MPAGSIVVDLLMRTGSFETDTARAAKSLKRLQKEAEDLKRAFKASFAGNLLADFTQQIGSTLARLPGEILRSIDGFNDLSDATGDSVENLSALEDIALRTGTSMDVASQALIKLNKALEEARKDKNSEAGQAIRNLGLDIDALLKLSPVERLQAVGRALNGFGGENKLAYNMALLGKSVRETAPLLKDLGEADELVGTITTQTAAEVEKFNKELFKLQKSAIDASRSLASPVVSALNETIAAFRKSRAEGESWWRFITDRFNRSNGILPPVNLDSKAGAGRGFVNPEVVQPTLKPLEDPSKAKGGSDSAAKKAAAERLRLAEFAAQQLVELEEITARETAEAWSYVNRQIMDDSEERIKAEKTQWQQVFDFIDAEQERAIEEGKALIDAMGQETSKLDDFAKNAAENIQRSFGDTLVDAMNGNFRSIGQGFKQMLDRMIAEALAANIVRALFGADSKGNVTGTGGLLGGLLKEFGTNILGFADGGSPPMNRVSLVGERGPELFIPRTAGTIIPAGPTAALAGMGGSVSVVNNFSISGPVDRRTEHQIALEAWRGVRRATERS